MTAGDEIEMLEYGQDQKKKQKSKKVKRKTNAAVNQHNSIYTY